MKFGTFLLDYEKNGSATIDGLRLVNERHSEIYQPDGQKNLYVIETEIIEERFFWFSAEYDDAVRFRDYVIDSGTGERQPNPRNEKQVEPRQQFFACFDSNRKHLYISPITMKSVFKRFLVDTSKKEYQIRNIYASLDEFCSRIKIIKGFKFMQVDNLFSRNNDIFKAVTDYSGLDFPDKLQLYVSYGDIPAHKGRALIDRLHRDKDDFENVIIIGTDDSGMEETFDFSSVISRIDIHAQKDDKEHFDPQEVKNLLLAQLR